MSNRNNDDNKWGVQRGTACANSIIINFSLYCDYYCGL